MEAMGSEDPLDKADFDPIAYLNHLFPTERSLDRLDPFVVKITSQISLLDAEMSKAVQAQSEAGQQAVKDVAEARAAIAELFGKVRDIKAKAEQSEVMVQEICRDIRQLDHAKRHLQTTITALKRLHMLVTAVDQLQAVAQARQYREAANLLDAVRQLLTHFESYASVPRIVELRNAVSNVKRELTSQIHAAFDSVGQLASSTADPESFERAGPDIPGQFRSLHEACLVVDSLGAKARAKQINSFCEKQLGMYSMLFPPCTAAGPGAAGPESMDRRFAWFRRLQRSVDTRFEGCFPPHWHLPRRLCNAFMEKTRAALLESLGGGAGEAAQDVQSLLKTLQKVLAFEKEQVARFEAIEAGKEGEDPALSPENGGTKTPDATDISRSRSGPGDDKTAPASKLISLSKDGTGAADDTEEPLLPIAGLLSGVFDPYMGPYIALEKKKLGEVMAAASKGAADDVDRDGKLPVLSTSVNAFAYIKNSVNRCTKLTTGQTFFKLYKEFKGSMAAYAAALKNTLPLPVSGGSVGLSQQYKIAEGGEVAICYVINTSEYCAETLPQLEEIVKSKIDVSYKDSIDLTPEQDQFHDVIMQAIRVLHVGLETRADAAFRAMSAINWGLCESVGEESGYVRAIEDAITTFVPSVRELLSSLYFKIFCDKFAGSFLPSYLALLLRQRRINEMGTQQLLLDVYNLKTLMLKLPVLGIDGVAADQLPMIPMSYTKYVTKQMGKIEMVLKLIGTPDNMLVERFRIMWPDGTSQDLTAVMTLKGMRRADQMVVLETLGLDTTGAGGDIGMPSVGFSGTGTGGMSSSASMPAPMKEVGKMLQPAAKMTVDNTRDIASKMESSMRSMTSGLTKLTFR